MLTFKKVFLFASLIVTVLTEAQINYTGYLEASLMNDILFFPEQTDRYFSNGVSLDYAAPFIRKSPVRYLHIGHKNQQPSVAGLLLNQSMFTPEDLSADSIVEGDRPYASYLLLENYHVFVHSEKKLKVRSSFGLGVIGEIAQGGFMQNFIHSLTPNSDSVSGWEYQIANDFLITYLVDIEKGIVSNEYFQFNVGAKSMVGTLYDYIQGYGYFQVGLFEPYFSTPENLPKSKSYQLYGFVKFNWTYMFYDATLQGGVFNDNSPYVIPAEDIIHARRGYEAGVSACYKSIFASFGWIHQTEEFVDSKQHSWGYFSVGWRFN